MVAKPHSATTPMHLSALIGWRLGEDLSSCVSRPPRPISLTRVGARLVSGNEWQGSVFYYGWMGERTREKEIGEEEGGEVADGLRPLGRPSMASLNI